MKLSKRILFAITGSTLITAGLVGCNHHYATPEERGEWMVEKVSKELELDATQKANLDVVKDEFLDLRNTMHSSREQTRADVLAMLQQPELDRNKANAIVNQRIESMHSRSPAIIDAIGDFYDGLNDEQRAELREFVEHKMERHHSRF